MSLRQAAQQALEALIPLANAANPNERECLTDEDHERAAQAVEALEQALAEPEQEPVAWELRKGKTDRVLLEITNDPRRAADWRASLEEVVPLYTAPTPRKPLTDEEIVDIWADVSIDQDDQINIIELGRAIERAHGIKEQEHE